MCVNVKSFCPCRSPFDFSSQTWLGRGGLLGLASQALHPHRMHWCVCLVGFHTSWLCVDSGLALAKRIAFSGWIVSIIVTGVFKINRVDDCFRIKTK